MNSSYQYTKKYIQHTYKLFQQTNVKIFNMTVSLTSHHHLSNLQHRVIT